MTLRNQRMYDCTTRSFAAWDLGRDALSRGGALVPRPAPNADTAAGDTWVTT